MIKVGVTGGIGSGKTTVCKEWEKLGARVLYADPLAKELMVSDNKVRNQLIRTFGEEAYLADGQLNKPYLTEEAFKKDRVEELNAIVHPRVYEVTKQRMQQAEKEGQDVFVYEAALLLQHGRPNHIDLVVLVLADQQKRVQRVAKRDQSDKEAVLGRIEKQQDFEQLKPLSDYIIDNNGSLDDLKNKARELYEVIKERLKDFN